MVKEGTGFCCRFEFWPIPESPCKCVGGGVGGGTKSRRGRKEREKARKQGEGWGRKSQRGREWKFPSPNIVTPSHSLISN